MISEVEAPLNPNLAWAVLIEEMRSVSGNPGVRKLPQESLLDAMLRGELRDKINWLLSQVWK